MYTILFKENSWICNQFIRIFRKFRDPYVMSFEFFNVTFSLFFLFLFSNDPSTKKSFQPTLIFFCIQKIHVFALPLLIPHSRMRVVYYFSLIITQGWSSCHFGTLFCTLSVSKNYLAHNIYFYLFVIITIKAQL